MKHKGKLLLAVLAVIALTGAVIFLGGRDSSPIEHAIIDNKEYTEDKVLDAQKQAETISASEAVIVSCHYIESPSGTRYDVVWCLDGKEAAKETVTIQEGTQGIFTSSCDKLSGLSGELEVKIYYAGEEKQLYSVKTKIQ